MVVLAGGMATRFGGGVKAVAEAIDGRSFLEVKLDETERLGRALGAEIPVALMTSFATDAAVRAHVAETRARGAALVLPDRGAAAAPRRQPVRRARTARRRSTGRATATCSRRSAPPGRSPSSSARGVRLDRRLERRQPRRPRRPGRRRDAPPRRNAAHGRGRREGRRHGWCAGAGRRPAQLLEAMRFPPEFDQDADPGLQHEHLADRRSTLSREPVELTWLVAEKTRRRATGGAVRAALPRALGARADDVPRRAAPGPRGRFLPVKEPADLDECSPCCERCCRRLASSSAR